MATKTNTRYLAMLKWIKADIQYIDSHVPQQPFTVVDYTPTSKIFLSTELTEMTRVHIFDFGKIQRVYFLIFSNAGS